MVAVNLNMLAENASRLGMRLQETFSEHTRDLAIARGSGSAFLDNPEEKVKNIAKQLNSSSDREKLEAMKRLIAVRLQAYVNAHIPCSHPWSPRSSSREAATSPSFSCKSSRTSLRTTSRSASSCTSISSVTPNKSPTSRSSQSTPSRKTCPTPTCSFAPWPSASSRALRSP